MTESRNRSDVSSEDECSAWCLVIAVLIATPVVMSMAHTTWTRWNWTSGDHYKELLSRQKDLEIRLASQTAYLEALVRFDEQNGDSVDGTPLAAQAASQSLALASNVVESTTERAAPGAEHEAAGKNAALSVPGDSAPMMRAKDTFPGTVAPAADVNQAREGPDTK